MIWKPQPFSNRRLSLGLIVIALKGLASFLHNDVRCSNSRNPSRRISGVQRNIHPLHPTRVLLRWRLATECFVCDSKPLFVEDADHAVHNSVVVWSNWPVLVLSTVRWSGHVYIVSGRICHLCGRYDFPLLPWSLVSSLCLLRLELETTQFAIFKGSK